MMINLRRTSANTILQMYNFVENSDDSREWAVYSLYTMKVGMGIWVTSIVATSKITRVKKN